MPGTRALVGPVVSGNRPEGFKFIQSPPPLFPIPISFHIRIIAFTVVRYFHAVLRRYK